jgi:hypothetical protein
MKTIEQLKADLTALNDERTNITVRMMAITDEIEQRLVAAYKHKPGDIIDIGRGHVGKVKDVAVDSDGDVFVTVHEKLPSGRWSSKTILYW